MLERGSVAGGTGPIFLSELNCLGTESSLLECSRQDNQLTGLHDCTHQLDAAIRCRGTSRGAALSGHTSQSGYTDIDECQANTSSCMQVCTNTIGGYNCSCNSGFSLNQDMASCDGMSTNCTTVTFEIVPTCVLRYRRMFRSTV